MGLLSGSSSAAYKSVDRTNFTATAGQTTFTITQGYSVGDIDVYLNGVRLLEGDDYYATNGSTIVLNAAAAVGDLLQVVSYNQFIAANTYTKSEADSRYMVSTGANPMSSYLRTPNYGVSSWSDSANASLEASVGSGTNGVSIKAWGRSVSGSGGELTYVTDTRGASGQHIFYGYNGSTLTQFGKFDTSGRFSLPQQPSILLNGNNGNTTISGQYLTSTYLSVEHNYGGMNWDGANGRVYVPVAGRYLIQSQVYHYQTGHRRHVLHHNGNQVGLAHSSNSTTADESRGCTMVRNLAANDWVGIRIDAGYGGTYYTGYAHTWFSVHLLG